MPAFNRGSVSNAVDEIERVTDDYKIGLISSGRFRMLVIEIIEELLFEREVQELNDEMDRYEDDPMIEFLSLGPRTEGTGRRESLERIDLSEWIERSQKKLT